MLQVKHLTLTHRKDLRTLVDDFSFVLNQGDRAVLIGEEGNGKSTLLKWLWSPGLIEPYCEWSGELAGDPGPMGYLAQDIPAEEKEGSVYDFCAASPAFFDLTPRELGEIARQLRFPAEEFYSDRAVGTLSGGGSGSSSSWPGCCSGGRRCCCWMSPPVMWTWRPWSGWRTLSAGMRGSCSTSPTTRP